jgi:hypothetical protein
VTLDAPAADCLECGHEAYAHRVGGCTYATEELTFGHEPEIIPCPCTGYAHEPINDLDPDPDAPNPVLVILPSPEELAATNDDAAEQHRAVMVILRNLRMLTGFAIAEALNDPEHDTAPVNIIGITMETGLLERYSDYPDVLARLLVSHILDREVEAGRAPQPLASMRFEHEGRKPLALLYAGMGALLRTATLEPEDIELARQIRDELGDAIRETPHETPDEEDHAHEADAASDPA